MKWVILHKSLGRYLFTRRVFVVHQEFARWFNSMKQAKAYIRTCEDMKKDLCAIPYTGYVYDPEDEDRVEEMFCKILDSNSLSPPMKWVPLKY